MFDILVKPVEALHFGTTAFVDSIEYRVGGNAANTSRALAILGVPVRILGAVGRDDAATMVLDKLRACGVDTQSVMRMDFPHLYDGMVAACAGREGNIDYEFSAERPQMAEQLGLAGQRNELGD